MAWRWSSGCSPPAASCSPWSRGVDADAGLVDELSPRVAGPLRGRRRGGRRRSAALSAAAGARVSVLGLRPTWQTDTYRRLRPGWRQVLGDKTAKQFEALKIRTVGDLMHHLPRRYFSGTELSDLSLLQPGEEVAVMAEVSDRRAFNLRRAGRYAAQEAAAGGHGHRPTRGTPDRWTFFGNAALIKYWSGQLEPRCPRHLRRQGEGVQRPAAAGPPGLRHRRRPRARSSAAPNATRRWPRLPAAPGRALPDDRQAADLDDRRVRRPRARLTWTGSATRCRRGSASRPACSTWRRPSAPCTARRTARADRARPRPAALRRGLRAAADHGPPPGRRGRARGRAPRRGGRAGCSTPSTRGCRSP